MCRNTEQNEDESLAWEEVSCEHIVKDEWIDIRRSAYRFPDGTVFEPFYSYSRRDYVIVVATDTNGDYLCVRQFRQGIKKVTTEFCAGGIERSGNSEDGPEEDAEDALEAAKRELAEETGYGSDEWRFILKIPSNATIADNNAYIFEARNCRRIGEQELDDTEFLNVKKYSEEDLRELIRSGRFQQAIHILAFELVKDKEYQ